MKIQRVQQYRKNNRAGVSAHILFNNGKTHRLFFEVDEQFSDSIAADASPFLAAMLPIAMHTKEDIEIEGTVSKTFMKNTDHIMHIVKSWNEGFFPISIRVNTVKRDRKKGEGIGCFFSGGVDSYYTYIKNKKDIDSLIFVHGFDIKLGDTDLYSTVEKNIVQIANVQKVRLIKVKTNVRKMYDQLLDWDVVHGFAVGSVSLFLRNGFRSIYVSCGLPAKNNDHHSMTPDLDPLWSGEHVRVIHYGCHADKLLKLKELSRVPLVMKTLRVCWVNTKNAYNCGVCEKCYRNMLGLYLCGALKKCKTFPDDMDLEQFKKIIVGKYVLKYFLAIADAMEARGDTSEVRTAVEAFIVNNTSPSLKQKIFGSVRTWLRTVDKKYNSNRSYWFLANKGLI